MNKSRKPFAISLLVVIIWFAITGVFGPLFGKLTSVQENNNSSFLPKGAEATKAQDAIGAFTAGETFNFPTTSITGVPSVGRSESSVRRPAV